MTRLTVVAALFVLFSASPVAAQHFEDGPGIAPMRLQLHASDTLAAAQSQHRVGSALVATGLTAHLVGLGTGFFSFLELLSHSFEARCVGGPCNTSNGTDWAAFTATSLITSAVGLVLFFIGLGLDVHAHVLRGHATGIAMTPNGLSISF